MLNSRNFRTGIRLVGNTTLTGSVLGDLQSYTVDGQLYYNDGTGNHAVLTGTSSNIVTNKKLDDSTVFFVDTGDITKEIHFDAAGTTGTKTTITSTQTTNRVLTLPDATDVLIGRATIDTFTNKSIDGLTNTITNVSLSTGVTGTLPIGNGGTGQTTTSAAFDALSPMTTGGDLIYGGASGTGLRLANGSAGQVLTSAGTTLAPTWTTPSPGFINPMNSVGDLIVGGSSGTATRLGIGSTGQVLTVSGGTAVWAPIGGGTVTNVTASSPLASSGGTTPNISLTGIIPVVNGGTGSSTQNFVDLSTTQSISGAKTFNNALTLTQISTPATPSATHNDLYFKSDGFLYMLDSLVSPGISGTSWAIDPQITVTNSGTITVSSIYTRRVGDSMEISGRVTLGTVTSSPMSINLGTYRIDSTKLGNSANGTPVGNMQRTNSGSAQAHPSTAFGTWDLFYDGSTTTDIYVGATHTSQAYNKVAADSIFSNTDNCTFQITVPIAGWTVNNGAQPGQHGATFFASSQVTNVSGAIASTSFVTFDNSPALSITPTITGTYKVHSAFGITQNLTGNAFTVARIVNTSGSAILLYESQNIGTAVNGLDNAGSTYVESIYTLTAGNTYVFDIQGRTNGSIVNRGDLGPFYIFAELSTNGAGISGGGLTNPMTTGGDIIYGGASGTPTRLANGSAGQVLTSAGGTSAPTWAASGSFDYFASAQVTTNSSATSSSSYVTASNSPTFVFTPTFTGKYKVYGSIPLEAQGGPSNSLCKILNTVGSATLVNEQEGGVFNPTAGNLISSVLTQSVYTLTASTSYTFVLQHKILSGGANSVIAGSAASGNTFYLFAERIG